MGNGVDSSIKLTEIGELFLSIEDADIRISEGLSLVKESEGFDFASLILIAPESVAPRTQESRSFQTPKATVFSISSQSLQPRWFSADFSLSGDGAIVFQGEPITIPFFSPRIRAASAHNGLLALLDKEGVSSVGLLPVKEKGVLLGVLIVGYFGNHHFWRQAQRGFLLNFAELLGRHLCQKTPTIDGVSPGVAVGSQVPSEITGPTVSTEIQPKEVSRDEQKAVPPSRAEAIPTPGAVRNAGATRTVSEADVPHQAEFQRLLQYGQLILLKTDTNFRLTEIIGSSEKLFGFTKQELFGRENIWERFFDPLDLRRLALRLRRMGKRAHEFGEEIRYTRRGEDKPRWLLLKAAPVLDDAGVCIGWEGFGVDITERRLVELQLRAQRQRTEALYEVSRALRVNLDPALVTLKGLNALIRATGSDAGLCCFYDEVEGTIEMVAAEGLSQRYLDGIAGIVDGPNLVRYTVEQKKGILLDNVQEDSRAATDLARLEDLKSTVLMPLMSGGKVLGALVIFSREAGRYGREDFHLVAAAASQISFAARQAEFYTAEKAEADSLAVLYRLSHEISRLFRGAEIGEHVFSIIQQEFACKRLWFGILNNQATHIMGQAGFGPGIRQQVKEVQVELGLRHDFLDEAIRTKKPVLVNAGTPMECSGLNRLFQKLKPGTFVILPLVSLGQVVGVIVAEPVIGSPEYVNKKLSLLMRMANEVAVVLMARRFEERVAESDKMRVATMLASGVAHNFNNLLQAVMGQASLIQMHAQEDSPVQELARTIIDSAGKGASLVKHLLSFSSPTSALRERFSLSGLVRDSKDLYSSLLGGAIQIRVHVLDDGLDIVGDSNLIQQSITNMLVNAREAIGERNGGLVEISARRVRLSSGEIDPSLSPGTYARIDIKDNGQGMDEERLSRCFEPFYSSKDLDQTTGLSLSGAGLGLSSAYSLAQQHGGVLTASSLPGEGTTLSLFLPVFEEEVLRAKELVSVPDQHRRTALLIQPYGASGYTLQRMFESFSVRSRLVHDLEKARVILESPQQIVQLLVIDADYLGNSTVGLLEELREKSEAISTVILTVSREQWIKRIASFPNCILVEKPLSMRRLHKVMREFFEDDITFQSEPSEQWTPNRGLSSKVDRISDSKPDTRIATPLDPDGDSEALGGAPNARTSPRGEG